VTSALSVSQLSVSFGKEQVLKAITFDLWPAELLVILGSTGAGKTTLLRTLAGLENPSSGSIAIGGQEVTDMLPADRDVAMVFQNFSLIPTGAFGRILHSRSELQHSISRKARSMTGSIGGLAS
jgi:ABC-type sugar transport system ATPase subunit